MGAHPSDSFDLLSIKKNSIQIYDEATYRTSGNKLDRTGDDIIINWGLNTVCTLMIPLKCDRW